MKILSNQVVLNDIAHFRTMITKMQEEIANTGNYNRDTVSKFLSEADFLSKQMESQLIHMEALYNSLVYPYGSTL